MIGKWVTVECRHKLMLTDMKRKQTITTTIQNFVVIFFFFYSARIKVTLKTFILLQKNPKKIENINTQLLSSTSVLTLMIIIINVF